MISYSLILPKTLESRRAEFEGYIAKALENVRAFAAKYGWSSLVHESFFDKVMIFDVKNDFDRTLLELCKMDPGMALPESYCGALEERNLIAVSPEYYAKVYPQGIEPDSYIKLLTHEICHRLHVRILNGDEEAMGPVWFFEGFAIFAADQFTQSKIKLTQEDIFFIIGESRRGNYEQYSHVFKYFVNKIPLKELVTNASAMILTTGLKNMSDKISALILAGGKGTRMKSDLPKALFKVGNDTIIEHIVKAVSVKAVSSVAVVVSPSNIDSIRKVLGSKAEYILQPEAKGTGHAVMCAEPALKGRSENIIVFVGDAPFITQEMVTDLIDTHVKNNNTCTFYTAFYKTGEIPPYGRILRDISGRILKVVEEKDASQEQKAIREVLTSHYCFKTEKLFGAIKKISNENSGKEYYLTDVIGILIEAGERVETVRAENPIFLAGINTQDELELRTIEMNEYLRIHK